MPSARHSAMLPTLIFLSWVCAAASDAVSDAKIIDCTHLSSPSSRAAHCRKHVEVDAAAPTIVCVKNDPLTPRMVLGGGLLRLFDVEVVHIRSERLSTAVEYRATSEDTWLTGLVDGRTAVNQAHAAFAPAGASNLQYRLGELRRALTAVWSPADERSIAFSPFFPSCIGLRATSSSGSNVTVEWFREGPLGQQKAEGGVAPTRESANGRDTGILRLWAGPGLFLAGVLLYLYAPTFAESVFFHYAGGVTLSMVLGVLVIVILVWHRTGRRRPGFALAALLSTLGVTATAVRDWAREALLEIAFAHWPYVLAYLLAFACLGYGITFWRLRGGRPEPFECELLAKSIRLLALCLIFCASHSLRATGTLLLGVIFVPWFLHSTPLNVGVRIARKFTEARPAPAPTHYVREDGKTKANWRPATRSGQYMSQQEYEMSGQLATDRGLKELFNSPQYQKWLMENHGRMKMDEVNGAARAADSDGDD